MVRPGDESGPLASASCLALQGKARPRRMLQSSFPSFLSHKAGKGNEILFLDTLALPPQKSSLSQIVDLLRSDLTEKGRERPISALGPT